MTGNILDNILGWLLYLHPALGLFLISILLALLLTLAVKYLTNQSLMKDLRGEMKELQKEMKDLKNNPKKLSQINSRFMETNMKYMGHSWKPNFYTILPMLFIFWWLNAHLGYYPLTPDSRFTVTAFFEKGSDGIVTLFIPGQEFFNLESPSMQEIKDGKAVWTLVGKKEGEYTFDFSYKNTTYNKNILITNERKYAEVEKDYRNHVLLFSSPNDNGFNKVTIGNRKVIPFEDVPIIKDIPWINTWSWLGVYIAFSLIFSMIFRKVFNIY